MRYKLFSLGLVFFCGLMATGCKNELQQTAGEYSYKISGSMMVDGEEKSLPNESGALRVIDKTDNLLLTFNMLGGDVYTTNASLSNKQIEIAEFERIIPYYARDYKTKISGSGEVYENMIVVQLRYKGISMDKDSVEWENKDVRLVATRNK